MIVEEKGSRSRGQMGQAAGSVEPYRSEAQDPRRETFPRLPHRAGDHDEQVSTAIPRGLFKV